jgi:hypothetical protein
MKEEKLLTKRQLKESLELPSVRTIERLIYEQKIPVIKTGYRSHFFRLSEVQAALEKLTVKEVGA